MDIVRKAVFKNQIKSLLAHHVYVSVAHHRKRPVLPLHRGSVSCDIKGCTRAKQPTAGLINPGTAHASMSRLQLFPYGSHGVLWIHLVLEQGHFTILYGIHPPLQAPVLPSLKTAMPSPVQEAKPGSSLLQMGQLMSPSPI